MRRSTLAAGIAVLALAAAACTPQVTVEAEPAPTVAEGGSVTGTGIANRLAEIDVNRKVLADMAVLDENGFKQLVELAKAQLEASAETAA